jgi:TatD DNase family protein
MALKHPKCVAVGETGLDYYYGHSTKETQREAFQAHLQIAKKVNKPLIIHCRDAADDLLTDLEAAGPFPAGGVVHCFVETSAVASRLFALGLVVGFTGIITFKNAEALRAVVKDIPLEKMLIETDSPYLAPIPYRGKKNEPAFVTEIARKIAEIKAVSVEEVARVTWSNASKLFGVSA